MSINEFESESFEKNVVHDPAPSKRDCEFLHPRLFWFSFLGLDHPEKMRKDQSKVLWIVLAINATMFFVEFGGGLLERFLTLTGDFFDVLGDPIAYCNCLCVIKTFRKRKFYRRCWSSRITLSSGRQYRFWLKPFGK